MPRVRQSCGLIHVGFAFAETAIATEDDNTAGDEQTNFARTGGMHTICFTTVVQHLLEEAKAAHAVILADILAAEPRKISMCASDMHIRPVPSP
jgi:hypothetical protein